MTESSMIDQPTGDEPEYQATGSGGIPVSSREINRAQLREIRKQNRNLQRLRDPDRHVHQRISLLMTAAILFFAWDNWRQNRRRKNK